MEKKTLPVKIFCSGEKKRLERVLQIAKGNLQEVDWAVSRVLNDLGIDMRTRKVYLRNTLKRKARAKIRANKRKKHLGLRRKRMIPRDAYAHEKRLMMQIPESDR